MTSLGRWGARPSGRAVAVLVAQLGLSVALPPPGALAQQATEPTEQVDAPTTDAPGAVYNPTDEAFPYLEPTSTHWFRLTIEELVLLLAGSGYYFAEKRVNAVDWEFGYSWYTLQRKLVGDGYAFDDNYFNTNYISHSGAGALYYSAARANHLGVGPSLLSAFLTSALWELVGEFRERVSINDTFVTPLGGFAFGESMVQIGAFFDRSCDTTTNRVLGSFFATAKSVNDGIDGLTLARDTSCDTRGFTKTGEHRFNLWVASHLAATRVATGSSLEVGARAEILNLRQLGKAGRAWSSFSDGNVARLHTAARVDSKGLTDARIRALTIPVGVHSRNLLPRYPRGVMGSEWLTGLGAGLDYSQHRYAGDPRRDPFFVVEAPAWFTRWRKLMGTARLELELVVAGTFGGVGAFAQTRHMEQYGELGLTTVARAHSYNHVMGVAVAPAARWISPALEFSVDLRADRLFGLSAPDSEGGGQNAATVREARRHAELGVVVGHATSPRWVNSLGFLSRNGSVGSASRSVFEFSLSSGMLLQY
jgi:Domain of unknown function (DUF3943)